MLPGQRLSTDIRECIVTVSAFTRIANRAVEPNKMVKKRAILRGNYIVG